MKFARRAGQRSISSAASASAASTTSPRQIYNPLTVREPVVPTPAPLKLGVARRKMVALPDYPGVKYRRFVMIGNNREAIAVMARRLGTTGIRYADAALNALPVKYPHGTVSDSLAATAPLGNRSAFRRQRL